MILLSMILSPISSPPGFLPGRIPGPTLRYAALGSRPGDSFMEDIMANRKLPLYRPHLEVLETRTLPTISLPTPGSFGPGLVDGTTGDEAFVLRMQAGDNTLLNVSDNGGASFS